MDLTAWRARQREGEPYQLPSGLVVKLRRVGILDLVEQGAIPAPLLAKVEKMSNSRRTQLTVSDFREYADLIDVTVKAALVDPPVGDEGGDGVLAIRELPMIDRVSVFNWANPPTIGLLEPFRPQAE